MSEADDILKTLKKDKGAHIGNKGVTFVSVDRIPTGLFQFDLATGGGIPKGRVSIIYGTESSTKTTITHLLSASVQKEGKKVVFIDLENTYDADWAKKCGVNTDEVYLMKPESAEQTIDIAEAMLCAEDVGLVIIDSLGAMTTDNEIDSGGEKMIVGGASLMVGKLTRKCVVALGREWKRGHLPALVFINQIRVKIGVQYGDPETMPGGMTVKFASSLTIRLYGKDLIEKDQEMPRFKQVSGIIKKWKVPIVARNFEYELCVVKQPDLNIGQSYAWTTVAAQLKAHGILSKQPNGWVCNGLEFATLDVLKQSYLTDHDVKMVLQDLVVQAAMAKTLPAQIADGEIPSD